MQAFVLCRDTKSTSSLVKIKLPPKTYSEKVRDAIETLESKIDERLHEQNLIGKVSACSTENKNPVRRRNVTFSWQRGIKIGKFKNV